MFRCGYTARYKKEKVGHPPRLAFFIVAGLMLVFGVGPFPFDVVKNGIIGCVFGLVVVAIANLLLESHYVRAGRAVNVEFIRKPKEPRN